MLSCKPKAVCSTAGVRAVARLRQVPASSFLQLFLEKLYRPMPKFFSSGVLQHTERAFFAKHLAVNSIYCCVAPLVVFT